MHRARCKRGAGQDKWLNSGGRRAARDYPFGVKIESKPGVGGGARPFPVELFPSWEFLGNSSVGTR
jgi:hypothetical protein